MCSLYVLEMAIWFILAFSETRSAFFGEPGRMSDVVDS